MDIVSLFLSAVGLAVSIWAILKARSAQEMAQAIIKRKNEQEDHERLRDVVKQLNAAKAAAIRRQNGAPRAYTIGRSEHDDLHILREAHDALKVSLPVSLENDVRNAADNAADQIEAAMNAVGDSSSNRDGWKDALSTLQTLIPRLEQEERSIRDRAILAVD